jgi:hypothetical protein
MAHGAWRMAESAGRSRPGQCVRAGRGIGGGSISIICTEEEEGGACEREEARAKSVPRSKLQSKSH